ncbi:MAG: hypothetical protein ABH840_01375 [Nanoarchaeota archaeon]
MINEREANLEKGRETETRFRNWLDSHNIPYFYIKQDVESFSSAFRNSFSGKRPDFLILIPNFGLIFVDVKYKKINSEYKTYPIDKEEAKLYSSLQRMFNLHIWYALSNEESDFKTWLWIPVSKVLELGIPRHVSSKSGMDFFPIPPEEFIQIADNDSLDRLFSKLFK